MLSTVTSLIESILFMFLILGAASLSGYFSEKVGIVNLSIDGQMIFGALTFSIFAMIFFPLGNGTFVIPMILSMVFSVVSSGLFGFLTIKLKSDHVISGVAINLLFAGLATFLSPILGPIISNGNSNKLKSDYVPIFQIGDTNIFGSTLIMFVIIGLIFIALWFFIHKTAFGLRFRAVGENPNAIDAQGINVDKIKWIGILISGALASLAGSIFMLRSPITFNGEVNGLGFLAIAILIAGSWKMPLVIVSSFVFAIIFEIFDSNSLINIEGLTYIRELLRTIPYVLSLLFLVIFSKKSLYPAALGLPFDKTKR